MHNRRQFLRSAVLAGSAVGLAPAALAAPFQRARVAPLALGAPAYSWFVGLIGAPFQVRDDDGALLRVVLTEAAKLADRPHLEGFSLTFADPAGAALRQGTYEFYHRQVGWFSMFIVPHGHDADAVSYHAVFNYLTDSGAHSIRQ